jgi:hypothetical protein
MPFLSSNIATPLCRIFGRNRAREGPRGRAYASREIAQISCKIRGVRGVHPTLKTTYGLRAVQVVRRGTEESSP